MGWRCRCICFLILAFGNAILSAQPSLLPQKNIVFDQLPDNLGLGQSTINCMLQDREGYLWIGTWSGLIRYDGYSTKLFHTENGPNKLKSNKITSLYEDVNGHIWIGTQVGGLFQYDKSADKFTKFTHEEGNPKSISNSSIWAITSDASGNLWVGTESGLNIYNAADSSFKAFFSDYNDKTSISNSFVTDMFLSSDKELWVATENGLNKLKFDDKRGYFFQQYIYNEGNANVDIAPTNHYLHNYVFRVRELISGNSKSIWYTTTKGLKKLENEKITNYDLESKEPAYSYFRSLYVVNTGHPYVLAGSEMGLNFFDPDKEKFIKFYGNYDKSINLSHNSVTSIFIDRGDVLWVGTKKGLNKYNSYSKDFKLYLTAEFDNTNSIITGFCKSADGGLWLSTIGGGLFKFIHNKFTHYEIASPDENSFTEFIQTLFRDSRGTLWIGTAGGGVYSVDEKDIKPNSTIIRKFNHYQNNNPVTDSHIMSFTEDDQHAIWVGLWTGGVNKIDINGKVTAYPDATIKDVPVVSLYADRSGVLWVGTRGNGFFRVGVKNGAWQLKQFKHDENKDSTLVNDFINSIYEDHAGSMWIGTEGGLVLFDRRTEKFSLSIPEDGLTNNVIVSMLEDDDGKLWLAHWNGLSVFDPTGKRNIVNYDYHDRIQGGFYYNNVCFKNDDGLLFFGGSNGFNIIDSKAIDQNPVLPKIVVEDFQIFNTTVPFGKPFNGRIILDKAFDQMENIVLKYYENSISFEFSALDFAAPEKIRYAYKLEGFDANWNYTNSSRRYANYTNLKRGDYRLLVKATNTEGVWNEKVTKVGIVILPPWWKTVWAGIGYFIIFVAALYIFRRMVLMRVNFMHELKVERMQRDNLEKLNKAKLQFFTNVSHEFRTPLTLILGPAQNLLDSFEGGKAVRDQILSINNNAQRLLRLVNQLLDFRKTESGNMKLEVAEGNMVKFIKEIKLSFDPLAEQMKIDFSISSSSNIIKAWFDRDQFEKIMFNLLSNAFKNTLEGGVVSIRINENKESLSIIVEDNGKGIKVEHFDNIFQSFFSYDEEHHHTGTGIGLALTKSLIEMHHGEIRVESEEHVFTRFILTMPLGNKHFDQSELIHEIKDIELAENYQLLATENAFTGNSSAHTNSEGIEVLPKLLIVEDNPEVRAFIKSIFIGKYTILEAEEGKEGLNVVLEEIPDLVISDVMMPIMDGITLCKEIKSNMKTSHIPVILLTARTSLIFKVEGLETGADDYVTKPFNPRVLELKVRNIMRTHEVMRNLFRDNDLLVIEPKRVTLNSSDERFIQQALESIEKNMSNADYSVEDLGMDVGMSRMQLYRKLKALTGQSANEFIRTIRLKRAAQLLEQNQLTIAEVTYEVGFTDLQYFRECFKKAFSLTPSEYVQKKSGTELKDADAV